MSAEETDATPRANPVVRWFLIGLPLGLLLLGAVSFLFYFQRRHAKEAAASAASPLAAMLRKDLNLDDYRRFIRIFEKEIGPRNNPDNLEAARSFIESTLGYGNMGYQVLRREFPVEGKTLVSLEVELAGSGNVNQAVLVVAPYDGADAPAIASLLCLAQSLTGKHFHNSVRLVALEAGESRTDASGNRSCTGAISYVEALPMEWSCVTVRIGSGGEIVMRGEQVSFPALDAADPAALDMMTKCREMILQMAESPVIK